MTLSLLIIVSGTSCTLKPKSTGRITLLFDTPSADTPPSFTRFLALANPPATAAGFICYGMNIVGSGIPDSSRNPDSGFDLAPLLRRDTACAYRGILAGPVYPGSGQVALSAKVPAGSDRLIQMVGINRADFCAANFEEGVAGNGSTAEAYEIGRARVNVFNDLSLTIANDYVAANAGSRRIDCESNSSAGNVTFTNPTPGGYLNFDQVNSGNINFTGTCRELGNSVTLAGPIAATATVPCLATGWLKVTSLLAGVPDGPLQFVATHSDAHGAISTATLNLTKDTILPGLAFTSPPTGAYVNAAQISAFAVSGTCTENGAAVELNVSGTPQSTPCSGGVWTTSVNATNLADGNFGITALHLDAAGNPAIPVSRIFVKDSILPLALLTSPADNATVTAAANLTIIGTCSEAGSVINLAGGVVGTTTCTGSAWSVSVGFAGAPGAVNFSISATDFAGNQSLPLTSTYIRQ